MKIQSFKDKHIDDIIIVSGCGTSAKDLLNIDRSNFILFGVNDISRLIQPDYLMVVDQPNRFPGIRHKAVTQSGAKYLFTQIDKWQPEKPTEKVLFKLGVGRGKLRNAEDINTIDYSNNSPWMAILLAYKMGCKNIGMIGVDFTPNHFYANDGQHTLIQSNRLEEIQSAYKNLYKFLNSKHVNLYNLSNTSVIKDVPKMNINEFIKKYNTQSE
jgi:hypothetical protein